MFVPKISRTKGQSAGGERPLPVNTQVNLQSKPHGEQRPVNSTMLSNAPAIITPMLIDLLRRKFRLDWNGIHGVAHCARVRTNGLRLACDNGANPRIVEYFAFLHDVCRRNDGRDPGHGARAARFAHHLRTRYLDLDDGEFSVLVAAIGGHTHGASHEDLTVLTCWDADRLDLGRVGIEPAPERMCTAVARNPEVIANARDNAQVWLRQYLNEKKSQSRCDFRPNPATLPVY